MKKAITLALTLSCLMPLHAKAEKIDLLERVSATIRPSSRTVGPIFVNDNSKKAEYGREIAKIILKEAHEVGKKYLDYGDYKGYYSFLVLSLTVPLQEGVYVHFREIENDKDFCYIERSTGKKIENSKAKKNFKKAFNDSNNSFLIDSCKDIKNEKRIKHLIAGGADGSDVGIMQISTLWHYDEFLAKKKYESVKDTVRYGLQHIMNGFRPIYANYQKYPCLLLEDGKVNHDAIIKGSWAGKYNSGNLGSTCRFADTSSAHAGKDKGFNNNLKKTINVADGGEFGLGGDLALNIDESTRKVLKEVIENYKNGSNNRTLLDSFIAP